MAMSLRKGLLNYHKGETFIIYCGVAAWQKVSAWRRLQMKAGQEGLASVFIDLTDVFARL
jgi:hypothetical protein